MVLNVDVLSPGVKLRILSQGNSGLIITEDDSGGQFALVGLEFL